MQIQFFWRRGWCRSWFEASLTLMYHNYEYLGFREFAKYAEWSKFGASVGHQNLKKVFSFFAPGSTPWPGATPQFPLPRIGSRSPCVHPALFDLATPLLGSKRPSIGNGIWAIEWSREQWRHVTLKDQTRDPIFAESAISRKRLDLETPFQRTTNGKWHMGYQIVTWPMNSRDPQRRWGSTVGYPSDSLVLVLFVAVYQIFFFYLWLTVTGPVNSLLVIFSPTVQFKNECLIPT